MQKNAIYQNIRDQCYIVWDPVTNKSVNEDDDGTNVKVINGNNLKKEFARLHKKLSYEDRNLFMQWYNKGSFKKIIERDGEIVKNMSHSDLCKALGGIYFPWLKASEKIYYSKEDEWMYVAMQQFDIKPSWSPPGYIKRLSDYRDSFVLRTMEAVVKSINQSKVITKEEQIMAFDCLQIMMAVLLKRRKAFIETVLAPGLKTHPKQKVDSWNREVIAEIEKDNTPAKTSIKTKLFMIVLKYLGERYEEHLFNQFGGPIASTTNTAPIVNS